MNHKEIETIYEPNQRLKLGPFKIWLEMLRNIINSRELICQLFRRDFIAVYKKSFLGSAWIFISPLVGIISWVLMNYAGVLQPGEVGVPYPAYVLISSSIWGLFMGFYSSASGTLSAGEGFIMQVNFPHEALLIKQTSQHVVNFLLGFLINVCVLFIFGVIPSWKIVFFPLMVVPVFFFGASIGLIVSVIGVVAQDVSKIVNLIIGLLMYITPVIYSPNSGNEMFKSIVHWNPLTYLIGAIRDLIIYGRYNEWEGFIYSTVLSVFLFFISLRFFYLAESKVVEKMI